MRRLAPLGLSLVMMFGVCATGLRAQTDPAVAETCGLVRSMAGLTMEWRQDGRSLGEMLRDAENAPNPRWRPVRAELAMLAYEEPVYRTTEMQERTVREFANEREAECYRDLSARQ